MWARSLFRTTASGVLSRTSPCDVQAGLLVGFIRSPGMSESANGSNEVWFVPPQSPCFLRSCWTAFLNSLQSPKSGQALREECGGEPLRFTMSPLQRVTFVNAAEIVKQQCLYENATGRLFPYPARPVVLPIQVLPLCLPVRRPVAESVLPALCRRSGPEIT